MTTVSEARAALPGLLDRVERGEEVTITRHGRAVAVLVRPDTLRSRRAVGAQGIAEQTRSALAAGRNSSLRPGSGLRADRAEALVREINTDRDARP